MPAPAGTDHDSRRWEGLAWSHEVDLAPLLAAIGGSQLGEPGDEQAAAEEAAAMAAAADAGSPARDVTGVLADQLPPGPALAACVSGADPAALSEWDLPGVASAFRRLAAWAQAGELAAVAEMASRTAARDDHARVAADGRPDRVTAAAGSAVGLELVMSHPAAMAWTGLAVTLRWRLAATLAALSAGIIDLYRARLIAEATGPLDDDTARAVESAVLPGAGGQTSGQLRVALRRAVIAADPEGAEQRRRDAQRHAKVSLYPDPDADTATLAGTRLPAVHAAAAMARLTAMARAMKAAGMGGGLDYLRAIAFIGLVLGTLPLVPPPAGDPGPPGPTDPDPDAGHPDDPGGSGPGDPGAGPPGKPGEGGPGPGGPGSGGPGRGHGGPADPGPSRRDPGGPGGGPGGPADPGAGPSGCPGHGGPKPGADQGPGPGGSADPDFGNGHPGAGPDGPGRSGDDDDVADDHRGPQPDVPPDPDPSDAPPDDHGGEYGDAGYDDEDDGPFTPDPPSAWPPIPGTATQIPPFPGQPPPSGRPPPASHSSPGDHSPPRYHSPPASHPPPGGQPGRPPPNPPPRGQSGRPPPGLLELVISWRALTGDPAGPATLSRIGPITGNQARLLALTAAADPHARWQVILTDPDGYAIAAETIRRRHRQGAARRPAGVTGQVTVTIPATVLDHLDGTRPGDAGPATSDTTGTSSATTGSSITGSATIGSGGTGSGTAGPGILAAVLRAARRAHARARRQAAADAAAPGGCAHTTATPAYRPTSKIRDYVTARDQTCRNPRCRQPAHHADLDHTTPYDQGGLTCECNLGGHCRTHHKIKQLPGWTLTQPRPGHFQLTTPAGRTYITTPDPYPA